MNLSITENIIFKGFAYVTSPYASYFWHHSPFSYSKQQPLVPFVSFPHQAIKNRKVPLKTSKKPTVTPVISSNSLSDIRPQKFVLKSKLTAGIKTAIPVQTETVKETKVKTTINVPKTTITPLTTTTIPVPTATTVKKTTSNPIKKVKKTTITPLTTTKLTTTKAKQIKAKATTDSLAKISLPKTIVKQTPLKTRTVTLTTTIPTTTTKTTTTTTIEEIREKATKR